MNASCLSVTSDEKHMDIAVARHCTEMYLVRVYISFYTLLSMLKDTSSVLHNNHTFHTTLKPLNKIMCTSSFDSRNIFCDQSRVANTNTT
jgi:hypothetical protein